MKNKPRPATVDVTSIRNPADLARRLRDPGGRTLVTLCAVVSRICGLCSKIIKYKINSSRAMAWGGEMAVQKGRMADNYAK